MSILNYKGFTFSQFLGDNIHILYFHFISYEGRIREVTIHMSSIGRKQVYLAEFEGLTTQYDGSLIEVLDSVIDHYEKNKFTPNK